jgi:bifunctional oligoribonuclease and PAP phosphatase NrnA
MTSKPIEPPMEVAINELIAALKDAPKRISIITHMKPDGDALGSSLGLAHFLAERGHKPTVIAPTAFPESFRWMKGADAIVVAEPSDAEAKAHMNECDYLFCLDFGKTNRVNTLGDAIWASPAQKVLVDHHLDFDTFAQHILRDVSATSTCELIYRFTRLYDEATPLSPTVAECLYTGIMTDTKGFRIPNTSPAVLRIAAQLVEWGVRPHVIDHHLNSSYSENRLRFLGYCLYERLVVRHDLHAAWITIPLAAKQQYNIQEGETEGLVNQALEIKGINFSLLITEDTDKVRLSTRSFGQFSANNFCHQFGGGGHYNAAGARLDGPFEAAVARIVEALEREKSALDYEFVS